jgi:hypothetical protein
LLGPRRLDGGLVGRQARGLAGRAGREGKQGDEREEEAAEAHREGFSAEKPGG